MSFRLDIGQAGNHEPTLFVESAMKITALDPLAQTLLTDLARVRASFDVLTFDFQQLADPATYRYRFTDATRTWLQILTFASATDADPQMTFNVGAGWKLSEFSSHRALRDLCVLCRVSHGTTRIHVEWPA